jgi:hypothetical protein
MLIAHPHKDFDVTIIWHTVNALSNFIRVRKASRGPLERILVEFTKVLENSTFEEVYCVSARRHLFCVTAACMESNDECVMDQIHRVN